MASVAERRKRVLPGRASVSEAQRQIERLVELLSSRVGCPVVLEDAHYRLVAYSPHTNAHQVDPARWQTVLSKRAPQSVVERMQAAGIFALLHSSSGPVRTPPVPEAGLDSRLAVAVRSGENVLGYLWVEEQQQPLQEPEVRLIYRVAQEEIGPLLARLLQLETPEQFDAQILRRFILQRRLLSAAEASRLTERFPALRCPRLLVVAVRHGHRLPSRPLAAWRIGPNLGLHTTWVTCGNTWYLVAGDPMEPLSGTHAEPFDRLRQELLAFFAASGSSSGPDGGRPGIGISQLFASPAEVALRAMEAQWAADIARTFLSGSRAVTAGEYPALEALLACWDPEPRAHGSSTQLTSRHAKPQQAAWLERLETYDRAHGTDLTRTLEVYCDAAGSLQEASSALHIHPNTLLYRLSRIRKLTQKNIDDGRERLLVHFELKAARLLAQTSDLSNFAHGGPYFLPIPSPQ